MNKIGTRRKHIFPENTQKRRVLYSTPRGYYDVIYVTNLSKYSEIIRSMILVGKVNGGVADGRGWWLGWGGDILGIHHE